MLPEQGCRAPKHPYMEAHPQHGSGAELRTTAVNKGADHPYRVAFFFKWWLFFFRRVAFFFSGGVFFLRGVFFLVWLFL